MKHSLTIIFLALGNLDALPDKEFIVERISKEEGKVSWYLVDGQALRNVKVMKERKGKWVKVEYTRVPLRTPPPVPGQWNQSRTDKDHRYCCWVNIDHITRIVPIPTRVTDPKEEKKGGDQEVPPAADPKL